MVTPQMGVPSTGITLFAFKFGKQLLIDVI
jgi:hypothetical protein